MPKRSASRRSANESAARDWFARIEREPELALADLRALREQASGPERWSDIAALRDNEGCSLCMRAALTGEAGLVEALWTDADATARDDSDWSALHHAAAGGSEACAQVILRMDPSRAEEWAAARSAAGFTPLLLAAHHGHLGVVRALLPASDPTAVDPRFEQGALAWAATGGDIACVRELLADPRAVAGEQIPDAILCAAVAGRGDALRELIAADSRWADEATRGQAQFEAIGLSGTEGQAQSVRILAELAPTESARQEWLRHCATETANAQIDEPAEDAGERFAALDAALSLLPGSHGDRTMQREMLDAFGEDALPATAELAIAREAKNAKRTPRVVAPAPRKGRATRRCR